VGRRIVVVGAPGSGKGTQSSLLADQLDVPVVSSGQLLRDLARTGTDTGREIARDLDRGELVPDDLIIAAVRDALGTAASSGRFVVEGFPRTLAQAERSESSLRPDAVIHLDVPDAVARARLAGRSDSDRTDDAEQAVIEGRLERFHDEIGPILRHYADRGVLIPVDADRAPDAVHRAIVQSLANRRQDTEDDDLAHQ
jgi:adenylate kinase